MNTDKANKPGTYKCVVRLEKKIFISAQVFAVVSLWVGLHFSVKWYWLVLICFPFEVASVAVLWWPVIEPANGVVREQSLLFGKKLLSEHTIPLNEFTEIFYKYTPGETGDTNYRLGLRHKTRRKLWIDGSWAIRRSVEESAWEISCKTGIKLSEWPA